MKKLLVRMARQSPALIVAMLALFVALTGTAVATTSALITGNQIKNNSITGLDVKNKSLTPKDFRGSVRGLRGLRGLTGAPGASGAPGAKGDKGETGNTGPSNTYFATGTNTVPEPGGGTTVVTSITVPGPAGYLVQASGNITRAGIPAGQGARHFFFFKQDAVELGSTTQGLVIVQPSNVVPATGSFSLLARIDVTDRPQPSNSRGSTTHPSALLARAAQRVSLRLRGSERQQARPNLRVRLGPRPPKARFCLR